MTKAAILPRYRQPPAVKLDKAKLGSSPVN